MNQPPISPDGRYFWDARSQQWLPIPPGGLGSGPAAVPNFDGPPTQPLSSPAGTQGGRWSAAGVSYTPPTVTHPNGPNGPGGPSGNGPGGPGPGWSPDPAWSQGVPPRKSAWQRFGLPALGIFLILAAVGQCDDQSSGISGEPDDQNEFVTIVNEAATRVDNKENDVAVDRALEQRGVELCEFLPDDLAVTSWVGTVENVTTELGGDDGELDLAISDNFAVGSYDKIFDGENTLIDPEDPIYDLLPDLSEGDQVTFSGRFLPDEDHCVYESSVSNRNGLETPDFAFEFTEVKVAD